jgi:hypothetical protein
MKKPMAIISLVAGFPVAAFADADGSCGVGSTLLKNQKGVAPRVFAMTTAGATGQVFAATASTGNHSII